MYRANRVLQDVASKWGNSYYAEYHHPKWTGLFLDEETFHPWFDDLHTLHQVEEPLTQRLLDDLLQFQDLKQLSVRIENSPLEKLKQFHSLETLRLSGHHQATESGENALTQIDPQDWKKLVTELRVPGLELMELEVHSCEAINPSIQHLSLWWSELDVTAGSGVAGLTELERLTLYDSIAEPDFWERFTNHPTLTSLELQETIVTGAAWSHLCRMRGLKELTLGFPSPGLDFQSDSIAPTPPLLPPSESYLRDNEWEQLTGLPHLEVLDLENLVVTESALRAIARLPRLRVLKLDFVVLEETHLAELGNSSSLRELDIYATNLTETDLATFIKPFPNLKLTHETSE